ncbi:AMP-binding protein [Rhodopila sp.]|uniref:AMP-binding protein n=1 Tax=Rhodopila sp. TaxID=2480087 RepID=UPI003D114FC1
MYPFPKKITSISGNDPPPPVPRLRKRCFGEASGGEPGQPVRLSDPWTLIYTSGNTGDPKGVVRNNRSGTLLSMVTEIELGIRRTDGALLVIRCVMPIRSISPMPSAIAVA